MGGEDRPQQWVMQHESGALADLLQRMTARRRLARGLGNSRKQHHRNGRQRGGASKGRLRAKPSHQKSADRRPAGKGNGAREFDSGIGRGEIFRRHQRRHQRRRGHAEGDRPAHGDEAQ
jgi:hypothetical protein